MPASSANFFMPPVVRLTSCQRKHKMTGMAKTKDEPKKNVIAQALGRMRAEKLSDERMSEIGKAGAEARWKGHKKKERKKKLTANASGGIIRS